MTAAVRSARTSKKPTRTLSYNRLVGVLTIAQGREESSYYLDPIRHDGDSKRTVWRMVRAGATAPSPNG